MDALGIVAIAVVAVGIIVSLVIARAPSAFDEIGGESPFLGGPDDAPLPTRIDDEADLRALVAEKRARRLAAGGGPTASERYAAEQRATRGGKPWAHLEAEIVEEARALVARRRARMERTGEPVPDEAAELNRLLGPPGG